MVRFRSVIYNAKNKTVNSAIAKIFTKNMLMKTKSLICPSYHRVNRHYFFMYNVQIM